MDRIETSLAAMHGRCRGAVDQILARHDLVVAGEVPTCPPPTRHDLARMHRGDVAALPLIRSWAA